MKQISLASSGFELVTKRTRKRVFLDEMSLVVPWRELVGLIQPFAPRGTGAKGGRPTFAVETMLRIHFLQQWFGLSDPAMEEALHDTPLYCEFARLDAGMARMPDETTILRFRHLLEEHNLSIQLLATINATLPPSNASATFSRSRNDSAAKILSPAEASSAGNRNA